MKATARISPKTAFINVPYDDRFQDLYLAFIAGLTAFGLDPRATLEIPGGARRLDRIFELITSCQYSFHDLSRVQLDRKRPQAPRFNGSIAECVGKGAAIARLVVQGRQQGRNVSWNLGALPPNPRNLALSGQNSCWAWTTMEALERRIGLRRNATRAPSQAPEWLGRLPSAP